MAAHNISEYDMREICPYCKDDLSSKKDWKSCFCGDIHYKSTQCGCGREINIKVEFQGSGHDLWSGAPSWMHNKDQSVKPMKKLDEVIQEHKDAFEDRRQRNEESDKKRREDD
jgi:hypothetical protein